MEQDDISEFSRQTIHGLPLCKIFSTQVDQAQTADKKFFVIIPLPSKIDSTEQHNVTRTSPSSPENNFDDYCNEPENAVIKTETICPQTDLANTFSLGGYSESCNNISEDWMSMVDCNTEDGTMEIIPEVKVEIGSSEIITGDLGSEVKLDMNSETAEPVDAFNSNSHRTVVTLTNQCFQVPSRVQGSDADTPSACKTFNEQEIVKYNDCDPSMSNRRSSRMQSIGFRPNYAYMQGKLNENSTAKCKLQGKLNVNSTNKCKLQGKLNANSTTKCKLVHKRFKQDVDLDYIPDKNHIGKKKHRKQNKRKADCKSTTSNEKGIKQNKTEQSNENKKPGIKLIIQKKDIVDVAPKMLLKVKLEDNEDKFTVVERRHSFAQQDRCSNVTGYFYHCLICDKYESLDKDCFESHIESHLRGELECEICGLESVDKFALIRHKRNDHSKEWKDPKKQLVCEKCGFLTLYPDSLNKHMFKKHQVAQSFACQVCKQMFKSKTEKKEHIQASHPERLLTCKKCKAFTYMYKHKAALLNHLRCCTGEGNSLIHCSLCEKTFSSYKSMQNHKMRIHHKVRRFSCELCPFTSSCNWGMKVHVMTHKGT